MAATWLIGILTLGGFRWDFLANPQMKYVRMFFYESCTFWALDVMVSLHLGVKISSLNWKVLGERTHHYTLLDGEMIIDKLPDSRKQERRYLIYDMIAINQVSVIEVGFTICLLILHYFCMQAHLLWYFKSNVLYVKNLIYTLRSIPVLWHESCAW